ncbi:tRNA (uridine(54)-C5)-methyltransferase TrmA [bacterium]|nr:tRNA (uridine(54)-C5)-methyltransferase TrmA [bacterium]
MPHPLAQFIPDQYQQQLDKKVARVKALFTPFTSLEPVIYPSTTRHFRQRAEFRLWHDDNGCHYAMFDPDEPKQPICIEHFPIASEKISNIMQPLLAELNANSLLKHRLFQVEFLSSLRGELLITLVYHKPLDEQWEAEEKSLEAKLGIMVIGRARKQKKVLTRDWINETLTIAEESFHYRQYEGGFTQPNAKVNEQMITWACQQCEATANDLLELYCGNGNFTLPLSRHYRRVLATEVSKTSIAAAKYNCQENDVTNITFVRLSSEETTQALNQEREFRRLAQIDLDEYQFSTVFVDPPRAGLDQTTLDLVAQFDHIIYISCNPVTLAENLQTLNLSHSIDAFALFDQFPYTEHCECGVSLRRRKNTKHHT